MRTLLRLLYIALTIFLMSGILRANENEACVQLDVSMFLPVGLVSTYDLGTEYYSNMGKVCR